MASILVVDDNRVNMTLTTLVLQNAGHRVIQAADSTMAIRLARERQPELIVLDIQLPGIDGLEVARLLKHDPRTEDIKLIALTALAMPGDEQRIRAAGCDDYVAKPFRYGAFLAKVGAALSPPKLVDAAA
jgi:two-component system cell cycle response regulator DivK